MAPDGTTAKRWVGQDGQRADEAVATEAKEHWQRYEAEAHAEARGDLRAEKRTEGFGVVEVDGVMVLTWKPGQEPRRRSPAPTEGPPAADPAAAMPAVASETSERAARRQAPSTLSDIAGSPMGPSGRSARVRGREVCVGLAYLGEHACQESPGRGVLLEKRYVATLNDRGCGGAGSARVPDAGPRDRSAELFRDQPLVGILDIQHARQHVWEASHKVMPSQAKTEAWAKPRVGEVLDGLEDERKHRKGAEQRKAIDSLVGYLDRHRDLMDYPRYRAAGYPIASAAVESTNKRLVGRRCKQGGMIWSEAGLEAMVALRLAFYNPGTWQRLWPHTASQPAA